jgi:hypothetical protein
MHGKITMDAKQQFAWEIIFRKETRVQNFSGLNDYDSSDDF